MKVSYFIFFFLLLFTSCVSKNKSNKLTSSSLPSLELNCPGSEAADCLGNPGFTPGAAASKRVRVVWMSGTCAQMGSSEVLIGASTSLTSDVGGSFVQYVSTFTYSNSETTIEEGTYALWVYFDTNDSSTLDTGEPVRCKDVSVSGEIGAIALINGWRDATTSDQTTLQ